MPVGREITSLVATLRHLYGVVTHVIRHEHEHEEEGYKDDHSVEQRPVQLGSPADNRSPTRLIVSKSTG